MEQLNQALGDALQEAFASEVKPLVAQAQAKLMVNLAGKGFVLTGKLLNSITAQARSLEQGLVIEADLAMRGYGKMKDLRTLGTGLNVDAMLAFVLEIGVDKFKKVPVYGKEKRKFRQPRTADNTRLAKRIAWGIAISRQRKKNLKRKGKGFFNPVKGRLEYDIMWSLAQAAGTSVSVTIKDILEQQTQ